MEAEKKVKVPIFQHVKSRFTSRGSVDSLVCIKPSDKKAKCTQCGIISYSHKDLPFFEASEEHDRFYCGCFGWS